jgi:hypothetical protein
VPYPQACQCTVHKELDRQTDNLNEQHALTRRSANMLVMVSVPRNATTMVPLPQPSRALASCDVSANISRCSTPNSGIATSGTTFHLPARSGTP